MTITEEITMPNGEELEVEFMAECRMENDGIGAYEYWGQKCFDSGTDYAELDSDITWDKTKYTEEQNKLIEGQSKDFWEKLEHDMTVQYKDNYAENQYDRFMEHAEGVRESKEQSLEERIQLQRVNK